MYDKFSSPTSSYDKYEQKQPIKKTETKSEQKIEQQKDNDPTVLKSKFEESQKSVDLTSKFKTGRSFTPADYKLPSISDIKPQLDLGKCFDGFPKISSNPKPGSERVNLRDADGSEGVKFFQNLQRIIKQSDPG